MALGNAAGRGDSLSDREIAALGRAGQAKRGIVAGPKAGSQDDAIEVVFDTVAYTTGGMGGPAHMPTQYLTEYVEFYPQVRPRGGPLAGLSQPGVDLSSVGRGIAQVSVGLSGMVGGLTLVATSVARTALGDDSLGNALQAHAGVVAFQGGAVLTGLGAANIAEGLQGRAGSSDFFPVGTIEAFTDAFDAIF